MRGAIATRTRSCSQRVGGMRYIRVAPAIVRASVRSLRCASVPSSLTSVLWRSWARVIRGRLPAIGRPNAEILHHGPPPAYARGQAAVGGAEPWPQVHPGILRGVRAAAGL